MFDCITTAPDGTRSDPQQRARSANLGPSLLRPLQVLLTERSVTRAGEILHLSQSAVSGILARLRATFDDPLLVAVGRRFELTPLAQQLIEPVSDLLLRIDALAMRRGGFDPASESRHFKLLASEYITTVLLADALQPIHAEAPGITIELLQPRRGEEPESADADLVLCAEATAASGLVGSRLIEDPYVALIDREHRDIGSTLSMEQFVAFGHVRCASPRSSTTPFDRWYQNLTAGTRRVEASVDSLQLLPALLRNTQRVALLPRLLAQHYCNLFPLRIALPQFPIPQRVETLYWHPSRGPDPANHWLRTLIIEAAGSLLSAQRDISTS
ncbi:MAG: LysR family transcriptional regulator [Steroidobacteraceae bacterium]